MSRKVTVLTLNLENKVVNTTKPTIVCLCGSTRFFKEFQLADLAETIAGKIVLSISCDRTYEDEVLSTKSVEEREAIYKILDVVHKQKIDLASEILVINVGGYIGASTQLEIQYAKDNSKAIRYLEAI